MVGKELSVKQVSQLSGLSEWQVRRAIKASTLPNLEAKTVGLWLKSRIQSTIQRKNKNKLSLHKKWD